ncbi:MAG: DNA-binding protein WhiA [Schwartzia sp.]|nr:DNA-binding protein WhiA [Schwartzia sp. (in: firmicutes)]
MASFASEVKNEIARLMYDKECCRVAELSGLLRMGGAMTIGPGNSIGATFVTENAAVARKAITLIKDTLDVGTETVALRSRRLNKATSYSVRVPPSSDGGALSEVMGLTSETAATASHYGAIIRRDCCKVAYLRGAFIAGGSVNRPAADYHMEFITENFQFAELIQSLLRRMEFPVGMAERKDSYVVYLKEGDAIVDVLSMFGAENAVSSFEVTRNVKEVRNQVNRLVNCETANLNKTARAAASQIADIKRITEKNDFESLPSELRATAMARLAHPEATITELANILGASRSGTYHRLKKLSEMAK